MTHQRSSEQVSRKMPKFSRFTRALEKAAAADGLSLKHSYALHICARLHNLKNYNTLSGLINARKVVRPVPWERAMKVLTDELTKYHVQPIGAERAAPLLAVLDIRPVDTRFDRCSCPLTLEEQAFAEQDDRLRPGDEARGWDEDEHHSLPVPLEEHPADLKYARRLPRLLDLDEYLFQEEQLYREELEAERFHASREVIGFDDEIDPDFPELDVPDYNPFDLNDDGEDDGRVSRRS